MKESFLHTSVLAGPALEGLRVKENGIYVDCTLGGGGHSQLILDELEGSGQVIAIDQDEKALRHGLERFSGQDNIILHHGNFQQLADILDHYKIKKVDGVLFDLGVSSPQLDEGQRGFSYRFDGPLDMRMDKGRAKTAAQVVNHYSLEELSRIIYTYGDERWAQRIASFIIEARKEEAIQTTFDLVKIIEKAIPKKVRQGKKHAATKTFQALRIEVNDEMEALETGLTEAINRLAPGGRLSVITFHSLEDRLVKSIFKEEEKGCTCPPDFPVCICHKKPRITMINRKPIEADQTEQEENRRARSAKLRIIEKLEDA